MFRPPLESPPRRNGRAMLAEPHDGFDFDALDTFDDILREAVATGDAARLREHVAREIEVGRAEAVARLVDTAFSMPRADVSMACLAIASGAFVAERWTMASVGKRFGLTRAAISYRCRKFADELGLRFRRGWTETSRLRKSEEVRRRGGRNGRN